jgi:hypothetical protein
VLSDFIAGNVSSGVKRPVDGHRQIDELGKFHNRPSPKTASWGLVNVRVESRRAGAGRTTKREVRRSRASRGLDRNFPLDRIGDKTATRRFFLSRIADNAADAGGNAKRAPKENFRLERKERRARHTVFVKTVQPRSHYENEDFDDEEDIGG